MGTHRSEEESRVWADDRIAPYKRPRNLFKDAIPMTFSLKLLRKDLRKLAIGEIGTEWKRSKSEVKMRQGA